MLYISWNQNKNRFYLDVLNQLLNKRETSLRIVNLTFLFL